MTSIVVPAHDEGIHLGDNLAALLEDARPDEFEVVVVANGCTDQTEAVVRAFGTQVRLVSLPQPGKAAALNAGDAAATRYPRIYLDADVTMPTRTVRALADRLDVPEPAWATPTPALVLSGASAIARRHAQTWYALDALRGDLGGTGVYALNEAARRTFGPFPDLIADDLFIRTQLASVASSSVDATVLVRPPRSARDLLRVRTRVHAGNLQHSVQQGGRPGLTASGPDALTTLAREPRHWPGLLTYVALEAVAQTRARRRRRLGEGGRWSRDGSTRR